MKKLSQILVAGVVTLAPLVFSSSASATGTCPIGFTGPDSTNVCVSEAKYECTVKNDNILTIVDKNKQEVATGTATGSGNGTAGSVNSGSATNSNGVTFTANVTNTVESESGGQVCVVVATVPAVETPVTPVTPTAAATPTVPLPQGRGAASGLPNTSADSVLPIIAVLIGAFGALAVISRLAIAAYSRK